MSPDDIMLFGACLAVVFLISGGAVSIFLGWKLARHVHPGAGKSEDRGRAGAFLASDNGWIIWNRRLYGHKNPEVRRLARRLAIAQIVAWILPAVCLLLSWVVAKLMT